MGRSWVEEAECMRYMSFQVDIIIRKIGELSGKVYRESYFQDWNMRLDELNSVYIQMKKNMD